MTRPSNILVSTVLRNQRFRGPTSSYQQNDFQAEVIRDITAVQGQWNDLIVPLLAILPDGTTDSDVDAFKNGLDGRTLLVHAEATSNLSNGQYYLTTKGRPHTVYEQFLDVYATIDTKVALLESQISEAGGAGGLTSDQQAAIGLNIFNSSLASSPTSIDGRSSTNQLNILQLAKDMYGSGFATFSGTGDEVLANSVRAMVDALLELHDGNWDNDVTLTHALSADDITSGTLLQNLVGPSSGTGTGVSDSYTGSPTHLVEDLNLIRTQIRRLKDNSNSFSTDLSLNANWSTVSAQPTDFKLLTNLKGSASRSDSNPWGYQYDDVDGLETRLQAGADYAGQSSLTDDTPNYSSVAGFVNGDDLTTAVGGLSAFVLATGTAELALATLVSGHIADLNNPHDTDLGEAATAGGFAPAGQITIVDSGSYYESPYVEGALQQVYEDLTTTSGLLDTTIAGVSSDLTTVSGTLQSQIDTKAEAADLTTISGTLQGQIDSLDSRVTTAEGDITANASNISNNTSDISNLESEVASTTFRRYEFPVSGLADDADIYIPHSGGMYPQIQVMTFGNLTTAGYNAGSVLPIFDPNVGSSVGILAEHSGVNNIVLTNKLGEALASGLAIVNW